MVNTARLPGFAAESALYRSRSRYGATATGAWAAKADIRPQLPRSCKVVIGALYLLHLKMGRDAASQDWDAVNIDMGAISELWDDLYNCTP
jgi:hypothetical protein